MSSGVIIKNPAILSGEPVFRGTRVPFKSLTDYLGHGRTLDEFLDDFPSVTRSEAIAALEEARINLAASLKLNCSGSWILRVRGLRLSQLGLEAKTSWGMSRDHRF
jgi:uncharacterized protein (DUF433 family)